ncbi:MAG: DUF3883 domain-containing protein [Campylobacteraceae bacterium]|nr:DUF3883 domain-containing protein [Campylobacteraceae bacterium]
MSVFLITATDDDSKKNYKKTLTTAISVKRKNTLVQLDNTLINEEIYAWGFPNNEKNIKLISQMMIGDICFFYGNEGKSSSFIYAFRIKKILMYDKTSISAISNDFWDNNSYLPYLIDKPIKLNLSTLDFSKELDYDQEYYASHVQSSAILANEERGALALDKYGNFTIWAIHIIGKYALNKNIINIEEHTNSFIKTNAEQSKLLSKSKSPLFKLSKKSKSKTSNNRKYNSKTKSSIATKVIGDRGEEAVLKYLEATLPSSSVKTLKWIAEIGEKPGWDIEYIDSLNNLIAVEVKTTTSHHFSSINITANEYKASKEKGDNYHLYLVSNCFQTDKEQFDIIKNPAKVYDGLFTPTMYRID